ncbi:MAG: efflux RND transporter permease subunit [Rhodocyclaceae bacterium]|nr:efflux RND transporter permease subunit [Rhodocyclaceae bacterium]
MSLGPETQRAGASALFVRRPVMAFVMNLLIIIAGLAALRAVEVRELPDVDRPVVTIRTTYEGATPETIDAKVTSVIEAAIARVQGVASISSQSKYGSSRVTVEFAASTNLEVAVGDVRDAVAGVSRQLPEGIEAPTVVKADADASPIIRLSVSSATLTIDELTRIVEDRIVDRLAAVDGVADASTYGLRAPVIRVSVNQVALASRGLTMQDVVTTLSKASLDIPAGSLENATQSLLVRTEAPITKASEIAALYINEVTQISDVARVQAAAETPTSETRLNGQAAIGIGIIRQAQSNTLDISTGLRLAIAELRRTLPKDVVISITSDDAVFIQGAIDEVVSTLFMATAIVILIIFMFLRSVRATLIPTITIPVSILGTIAGIWLAGFSINVISTFGLLIATGIVVDDAIVVIENTQRHLEMGKSRIQSAIDGAKEVLLPVTVAVGTTCFAFLPLTMVGGTMGRIMKILPLTVMFCLLGSLLEAIFILPGHLAHFASRDAVGGRTARLVERMKAVYRPVLNLCLRRRGLVSLLVLLGFVGTIGLATRMPFQFGAPGKPSELQISYKLPAGVGREATLEQGQKIRALVLDGFGVEAEAEGGLVRTSKLRVGSVRDPRTQLLETGANVGIIRFEFELGDEVIERYPKVVAALEQMLATNPDLAAYNVIEPQAGPPAGAAVTARVRGRVPEQIDVAVTEIKAHLRTIDGVINVDDDSGIGKETFSVQVDEDLAALYGLSELEIANAVRSAIDGLVATEVSIDEQRVEIVVRTAGAQALDRSGIGSLTVTTMDGRVVRLDQVAKLVRLREPGSIRRRDGQRAVAVTADVEQEVITALDTSAKIQEYFDASIAPRFPELEIQFGGDTEEINESLSTLPGAFMLAIGLIYIALALQFRSYVQPLIILCAVPFGIMGAVLGLFGMGYDLSLFALFGVVSLAGIVVNDSLVMVDFINSRRREGVKIYQAALDGALERLRPILSTTLTTCFGLGPLAVGLGGRDEILAPMAIAIAAGLGISTALVLMVVPPIYVIIERDIAGLLLRIRGKDPELVNALPADLVPSETQSGLPVARDYNADGGRS